MSSCRCTRDPTPLVLARRSKADLTNSTTTARRRQQGQQGCDFRFFLFRDVSSKLPQFSTLFWPPPHQRGEMEWRIALSLLARACMQSNLMHVNGIVTGVAGRKCKQEVKQLDLCTQQDAHHNAKEKATNVSSTTALKSQRFCPEAKFSSWHRHHVFVTLETKVQMLEKN